MNEIAPEIQASAEELSPLAVKFLDYAHQVPECREPHEFRARRRPAWIDRFDAEIQTWPTLVGGTKLLELQEATVRVVELLRSAPCTVFRNDPERFARFFDLDNPLLATLLLEPPNGLEGCLARCDFVNTRDGLQCIEVNLGTFMGGWQLRYWQQECLENRPVRRFLEREGAEPFYRDPLEALFEHVVHDALAAGSAVNRAGQLHLALAVDEKSLADDRDAGSHLNQLFADVCHRESGGSMEGALSIVLVHRDLSATRSGEVELGKRRVHALVEYTESPTPRDIYRCFKAGNLQLYSGPVPGMLGDKRILGLLSELEESDRLSDEEREVVRRHIPWTRDVGRGSVRFRGEEVDLGELLSARQDDLVLKPGSGSGGEGVAVGSFMTTEDWQAALERALRESGWVVQEHLRSRPYLYQLGEQGAAIHDVVWGTFCFGERYAGGFLRMAPREPGGHGVLNAKRGASEGILYEV